jgi:hypothetical protein
VINHRKLIVLIAALSPLASFPRPARAQEAGETVNRLHLIKAANDAHQKGHHDIALDFAKRAAGIATSATLFLFIAQEQEELGQVLDAYASAQECIHAAEFDPKTLLRKQAVEKCAELVGRLAPRIGQIVIDLPMPAPGSTLKVNGKAISLQVAGTPYPVVAGPVTIEAQAPGYQPFKSEISVVGAETRHVPVALAATPCLDGGQRLPDGSCQIPLLLPISPQPHPVSPPGPETLAISSPSKGEPATGRPKLRRWAYVATGTGVALLIGGAIAWEVAGSKFSSTQSACDSGCTVQARASGISSIQSWDTVSNVGFIAGGVLAAGGIVLFLLSPTAESSDTPAHVLLGFDPTHGSLLIGGRF